MGLGLDVKVQWELVKSLLEEVWEDSQKKWKTGMSLKIYILESSYREWKDIRADTDKWWYENAWLI